MIVQNQRKGLSIKDNDSDKPFKHGELEIQTGFVVQDGVKYRVEEPIRIKAPRLKPNTHYRVYLKITDNGLEPIITDEFIRCRKHVQLGGRKTGSKSVFLFWRGADFLRPISSSTSS